MAVSRLLIGVAKNAVAYINKDGNITVRSAGLTDFMEQNSTSDVGCKAMKLTWLSKSHNRVSLVTLLNYRIALKLPEVTCISLNSLRKLLQQVHAIKTSSISSALGALDLCARFMWGRRNGGAVEDARQLT